MQFHSALLYQIELQKTWIMPKLTLDRIDRGIAAELQADARLSNVELASQVVSPSPCLRRVKRMEAEGLIEGYRAILERNR